MGDFSIEERAWIVGRIYRLIAEYFAHWEDASLGLDRLDDVYRECLHEALKAPGRDEFVAVIKRWIGRLRNVHTWCYDEESTSGAYLGFRLERMSDDWVVIGSLIDGVSEGDVVELIDGRSPEEWMASLEPYMTGVQPKARESQWQGIVQTFWDVDTAALRIRDKQDRIQEFTHKPLRSNDPRTHSRKANDYNKRQKHTEGRWIIADSVGYIRIPSFSQPQFEDEALSFLQEFSAAQAIVFDVRSNDGGSTPSSLTGAIMDRPYRWWTETSPNVGHLRRRHPEARQFTVLSDGSGARCIGDWQESSKCKFAGKIIALTGRYAASAAEDFLMPLKDTGRAILIGETSGGSTGQPVFFDYQGIHVGVSSIRAYMPDGTRFEGVGIQPDVSVWRTRDDLYTGRDRVLEAALDLL